MSDYFDNRAVAGGGDRGYVHWSLNYNARVEPNVTYIAKKSAENRRILCCFHKLPFQSTAKLSSVQDSFSSLRIEIVMSSKENRIDF